MQGICDIRHAPSLFPIHNDIFHRQHAPIPTPRGACWGNLDGLLSRTPWLGPSRMVRHHFAPLLRDMSSPPGSASESRTPAYPPAPELTSARWPVTPPAPVRTHIPWQSIVFCQSLDYEMVPNHMKRQNAIRASSFWHQQPMGMAPGGWGQPWPRSWGVGATPDMIFWRQGMHIPACPVGCFAAETTPGQVSRWDPYSTGSRPNILGCCGGPNRAQTTVKSPSKVPEKNLSDVFTIMIHLTTYNNTLYTNTSNTSMMYWDVFNCQYMINTPQFPAQYISSTLVIHSI
jgi:hypothetical protein